jgi:hypothetical protein
MDQSIWNSKEFVAAIVGALVGGLMSMAASFLSVHLQNAKQIKDKEKLVHDFVVEHAAYFKELVDRLVNHFEQKNEVWFENVVEIRTAYDVVIRNRASCLVDQQRRAKGLSQVFLRYFLYFAALLVLAESNLR